MRRIAYTALILVGAAALAQADVYRWTDEKGRVHYTDRWVPGSELVKVDQSRESAQDAAARRAAEQNKLSTSNDILAARKAPETASQAVKQDVAKARNEQCTKAKEEYEKSIPARRLYTEGKDGEREYLSDAEADEARVQARARMKEACGG